MRIYQTFVFIFFTVAAFGQKDTINLIEESKTILNEHTCCSSDYYYNLGTSYLELKDYANAKFYLTKAKALSPFNEDINHNLSIVDKKVPTNYIPIAPFFISKLLTNISNLLSGVIWMVINIILLMVIVTLVWRSLNIKKIKHEKLWLMVLIFFFLLTLYAQYVRRVSIHDCNQAVIYKETPLYQAASLGSEYSDPLVPGDLVIVMDSVKSFYQVKTLSIDEGYVEKRTLKKLCN